MNFPENLKYTKDHEWVRVEGNEAFIGITEFAQRELGDIVYVDVRTEGETVTRDEVFGTVGAEVSLVHHRLRNCCLATRST